MSRVIIIYHEIKWVSILSNNSRFEIHKTIIKIFISNEIYIMIKGPTKDMLKMLEILDNINTCLFELNKLTFGSILWVQNLKKMTRQIRKTMAKDALKKLSTE